MEDERKRTKLRKSLQLYLSRTLKKIPPMHIPSSAIIPANIASARFLSTCRFPRTASVDMDGDHAAMTAAAVDENAKDHAATLSDVDRFLFDNFRSLYIHDDDHNNNNDRCFPSASPSTSTSHVEERQPTAAETTSSSSESVDIKGASRTGEESGDNTAIVVFSMDPYTDFRRSMQNMIKMHHGGVSQPLDWDFLEELLFYYLQLNDQAVHKHILRAFADLTAGTRHKSSSAPGKAQSVRSRKHH